MRSRSFSPPSRTILSYTQGILHSIRPVFSIILYRVFTPLYTKVSSQYPSRKKMEPLNTFNLTKDNSKNHSNKPPINRCSALHYFIIRICTSHGALLLVSHEQVYDCFILTSCDCLNRLNCFSAGSAIFNVSEFSFVEDSVWEELQNINNYGWKCEAFAVCDFLARENADIKFEVSNRGWWLFVNNLSGDLRAIQPQPLW